MLFTASKAYQKVKSPYIMKLYGSFIENISRGC